MLFSTAFLIELLTMFCENTFESSFISEIDELFLGDSG
jgi:hypothetical protein